MIVMAPELRAYVSAIFVAGGSQAPEAKIIADHLIDANLTGHDSHGIAMIPSYVKSLKDKTVSPNTVGQLAREDGSILVYDGERGWGQVVARAATEIAISAAHKSGLALLALRNAHHIGRVGAYGEQCAAAGLVSIHFVNATGHWPRVAPYGGRDARLPTNPFCVAIPGDAKQPPLILDMATSRTALGKVRVARNSGEQVAPGYLLDAAGEPTTEPSVMFDEKPGALLPVGEYKGYGLSLVCEILAGCFTEGKTIQPENKRGGSPMNSMMTIVFDPARTSNLDWARREIEQVIAYVKQSPPQSPDHPVLIPGDPERQTMARRLREGIPVDEGRGPAS
ncbi:MAG: malate/lactate/ureidoglycolate dehydrogenase [Alphaproteobacteria bacterium]